MLQEESNFYEALTEHVVVTVDDNSLQAIPCADIRGQQNLAEAFANVSQKLHVSTEENIRREQQLNAMQKSYMHNFRIEKQANQIQLLNKKSSCLQAERDLWNLMAILTRSDLLRDIESVPIDQQSFTYLSPYVSIKEVITAAYSSSDSIRKGKILKEWIENAASDRVTEISLPSGPPYKATLSRLLRGKTTEIKSIHPDAQLTKSGNMLPFDISDNIEQESLLKCIWQLIRCGDITRAQQIAASHNMFYLAASLLGIAYENHIHTEEVTTETYEENVDGMDILQTNEEIKIGNCKRALWLRTCSKYSTQLSACKTNWMHTSLHTTSTGIEEETVSYRESGSNPVVALLEMSIYAALSNNIPVLSRSPLMSSWNDRLWMYIKAAHERDIAMILYQYNTSKHIHSDLFSYSHEQALLMEHSFLEEQQKYLDNVDLATCNQLFTMLPTLDISFALEESISGLFASPSSGVGGVQSEEPTENLILLLQCSILQGSTALKEYIDNILLPLISTGKVSKSLSRIYAHVVIWLHLSCPTQIHLQQIIDQSILNSVVGYYIDYLMADRLIKTVATYACFLDRSLRIYKYIHWLNSLPAYSLQTGNITTSGTTNMIGGMGGKESDYVYILSSAKKFFKEDILDITRGHVEVARTSDKVSDSRLSIMMSPSFTSTPYKAASNSMLMMSPSVIVRSNYTQQQQSGGVASPASFSYAPSTLLLSQQQQQQVQTTTGDFDTNITRNGVDDPDLARIETLRWLSVEPDHRNELVRQINNFAIQFMLESSGSKVQMLGTLLTQYLPEDAIQVGMMNIDARHLKEDEIDLRTLDPLGAEYYERYMVRSHESEAWNVQVRKLHSWQVVYRALTAVETWVNTKEDLTRTKAMLLGNALTIRNSTAPKCAAVESTAETAVKAILDAIYCADKFATEGNTPQASEQSIASVWRSSESLHLQALKAVYETCCANIAYTTTTTTLNTNNSSNNGDEALNGSEYDYEIFKEYLDIFKQYEWMDEEGILANIELKCLECIDENNDPAQGYHLAYHSNTILKILNEEKQVFSLLVNILSTKYLQACLDTGDILLSILLPQIKLNYLVAHQYTPGSTEESDTMRVLHWFNKAVKYADIAANEDPALCLYKAFDKEQMQSMLSLINAGVVRSLWLQSDFYFE